MTAFTDWLADKNASRIVLVELVSASNGTKHLSDQTIVMSDSASPETLTIYEGRLVGDIVIERRVSGPLFGDRGLRGGAANVSDIVVSNPDGEYDAWLGYTWQTATIWYGDPSWTLAQIKDRGKRGEWKIQTVEADDLEIRFVLEDRYAELREPVQSTLEFRGANQGNFRPLALGYPKNVTPQLRDQDSTPVFAVGEALTVEDEAVSRYINQKASTSPSIDKYGSSFGLNGDPQGLVTCDVKGVQDPTVSPEDWLQYAGECLKYALTRTHNILTGIAKDGSSTTIQLDESPNVSAVDDAYNSLTIGKGVLDDPAQDDFEEKTITDYDGSTRTVTTSAWTIDAEAGVFYQIALSSNDVQAGPLTSSDLDVDAFAALDAALPYEIGVWLANNESCVDLLDMVLAPGGYHCWTPGAKLTCGLLPNPGGGLLIDSLGTWGFGSGGVTRTEGQSDQYGGTSAYKLERVDSALDSLQYDVLGPVQGVSYEFEIEVKNDDASDSQIRFNEQSPDTDIIGIVNITWTGATPAVSVSYGTISDLTATDGDSDWWTITGKINTGDATFIEYEIRPASTASANGEGIYVYDTPILRLAPALDLDDQDIQPGQGGIEIDEVQHPVWRLRVGYDKNHTVASSGSAGSVPPSRAAYIVDEYRWSVKEDFSILDSDPNAVEVDIETVFTTGSNARSERDRYWALFSTLRTRYLVKGYTEPMGVDLGQVIELTDARHGLSSGKRLVLLGIMEDLSNGLTEMELWG